MIMFICFNLLCNMCIFPVTTEATPNPVLSSAVLDLATQALQGCDSWVCKESSYRSIQIIFGTVLDR